MSKVAVVYWTGTGNNEIMANDSPDDDAKEACRVLGKALA